MAGQTSLQKDKIRILLLEGIHPSAVELLAQQGYHNVEHIHTALPEAELLEKVAGAHFIGIRSRTQLTAKVLQQAPRLIAIGCFCIGTNQVDLAAAQALGIPVFNAPYSNTRSVAELIIAEIILLLRGIPQKNAACHRGDWLKSARGAYEVRGKTLGLIGYGAIGSQISVLAESLGMRVIFYDTVTKLPLGNASQVNTLSGLLSRADVVSLHVPELPATRLLIGAAEIAQMKPGAILLNASRGTVVDIDALAAALGDGHLAAAAIDVFPREPRGSQDAFVSPLRGLDNALLTPHIGGSTMEAQENIGVEVANKLALYSDNGTSTSAVNFPEVALPSQAGVHRLLHIHNNIPGMLGAINQVFSDNAINISAQYLQTNEAIGYVVIDLDAAHSDLALEKLKTIPGTLRCRVLF